MAHLYVIHPARKLRLITTLVYRGSRRILGMVHAKPLPGTDRNANPTSMSKLALEEKLPTECDTIQDEGYYKHSDAGYCVFQVENTLFKLHKVLLTREPSVFRDMFSLAQPDDADGTSIHMPVFLSDAVEQFRDFLWALYASPSELYNETQICRLLNVAELTNKYCFSSLEAWVLERIYVLLQKPTEPLRSAPLDICAKMLNVAILCNHRKLLDLVTQHLIRQIIWYDTPPEAIRELIGIAKAHGLRTLQGAGYYRQLINMEFQAVDSDIIKPRVPLTIDSEQRMRFFSAHHSLLNLWDHLRTCPPAISFVGCPSHAECSLHWENMWFEAGALNETLCCGSADVLGRLKAMMITLRKSMCDAPGFALPCKMGALEIIAALRDEIIDGLMDHFAGY